MRAVNLIPPERRRDAGAGAGRSGGAVYVIMGGLLGLLAMAGLYALARRDEADRRTQLAEVTRESAVATQQASALAPYKDFASLRAQRTQLVSATARGRVEWALAIKQIVGVLPRDVHLVTLTGLGPGVTASIGTSSAPAPTTPGTPAAGPSFDVVGCASTHTKVGDVINLLRGIPGSPGVSLTLSQKASTSSSPVPCLNPRVNPQFDLTVRYPSLPGTQGAGTTPSAAAGAPGSAAPPQAGSGATGR